jgi:hypothetical protein
LYGGEVGGPDGEEFAVEVGDAGVYGVGFSEEGVEGLEVVFAGEDGLDAMFLETEVEVGGEVGHGLFIERSGVEVALVVGGLYS